MSVVCACCGKKLKIYANKRKRKCQKCLMLKEQTKYKNTIFYKLICRRMIKSPYFHHGKISKRIWNIKMYNFVIPRKFWIDIQNEMEAAGYIRNRGLSISFLKKGREGI
jgi:hypothetical protein